MLRRLRLVICLSLGLIVTSATAAAATTTTTNAAPVLIKFSTTGAKAKPETATSQRCEIFADRAVITTTYGLAAVGNVSATQTTALTLSANFDQLVQAAAADPIASTPNEACGYPTTTVQTPAGLVLWNTGGCGTATTYRTGGASSALLDLANTFCPKTYY